MPPYHDIQLRKAMEEWIKAWREYDKKYPDQDNGLAWREDRYQDIIRDLDSRKHLPNSITCVRCGHTSYNSHDIEEKYCGHCHQFNPF